MALVAAWVALSALAGCGKGAESAPAEARPTDDEVRSALKAHFYAHIPAGVVQKTQPDFSVIKVLGCTKSTKDGFECEFVNAAGVKIKDRFVKGAQGWEAAERIGG